MPDLAYCIERHQPDPGNEIGGWAHQFLPPSRSIGPFELLTRLSRGINRGFLYRRREAKGIQQPVETLRLGHGKLPRFCHADDRGGAVARFRRAVCFWVSRRPARRFERTHERLSSRVDPCLGANLFAGHRLDRFRSHERQRRQRRPCHRCGRARSAPCDPAPRSQPCSVPNSPFAISRGNAGMSFDGGSIELHAENVANGVALKPATDSANAIPMHILETPVAILGRIGRVAGRPREHGSRGVLLPQSPLG
jgi:hypothetical protein